MTRLLSRADFLRLAAGGLSAAALSGVAFAGATKNLQGAAMMNSDCAMLARPIPKSGEMLPVIGLGTWQTFDAGDVGEAGGNAAARDNLRAILQALFDGGASVIDTSPMYGRAEAVVGDLLAAMRARKRAFLATKVWISAREQGIAQMGRSAELLHTRVIDLMQIHNLVDWRTQLATLRRMKEAGELRYIGVTHYTPAAFADLAAIIEREEIDFVQLPYSIDVREAERRMLPLAAEHQVAVMVNRPFGGGGLFREVRAKALPPWVTEAGCGSWAQFFLKYIVSHPAVTCVIPATDDLAHLDDDLKAGRGPMPDDGVRRRMVQYWDAL